MAIQDFQLYHGALLAQLVRNERPVTLRMIETEKDRCWSAYRVDDAVTIYVKHSARGKYSPYSGVPKAITWTFTFQPEHLNDIGRLSHASEVYIALVCAHHGLPQGMPISLDTDVKATDKWIRYEKAVRKSLTGICFLNPEEWHSLRLTSERARTIKVELARDKWFLVDDRLRVPRNRLSNWQVPELSGQR